jgi:hypothetical protein
MTRCRSRVCCGDGGAVAARAEITMEQVLTLLGFRPVHRSGVRWYGVCPLHGSASGRSRSFSVNVAIGRYFCHRCRSHGNQLDHRVAASDLSLYQAAIACASGYVETCPGFVAGESPLHGLWGKQGVCRPTKEGPQAFTLRVVPRPNHRLSCSEVRPLS